MNDFRADYSHHGFSIVSVLVAISLSGVLAIGLMNIFKNSANSQVNFKSGQSELALEKVVSIILNKTRHCTQSFSGLTFFKSQIDFDNTLLKRGTAYDHTSDEGLNVELWQSNSIGDARTHRRLNGEDNVLDVNNNMSRFDNLTIKSIKLIMNNGAGPCSDNYCEGTINDTGQLVVVYDKPVSAGKNGEKQLLKKIFDLNLTIETDSSNESTISSCSMSSSGAEVGESPYPEACKINLYHNAQNMGMYTKNVQIDLQLNEASFAGIRTVSDVDNNDRIGINPSCSSPSTDIDHYFRDCYIGFGWRDSSRNNDAENLLPYYFEMRQFRGKPSGTGYSMTNLEMNFSGSDVNEDDHFYIRLACEKGTHSEEIHQYVTNTCGVCIGHSDNYNLSPQSVSCIKAQDYESGEESTTNNPKGLWARIGTNTGDVDNNDSFFIGFYCNNQYVPYIKEFSYD